MAKTGVIEQSRGFLSKLSLAQKLAIFGVMALVAGGIIYLIASTSGTEYAVLYNSVDEADASKIVEKLKEKNIKYELRDNGKSIAIPKEVLYETRLMLAGEGLPESSVVGYEIFDKTNLGMSEFVQKTNYRRALEGELARTIGALDEVKKVRVHIVIPEKALFEKDQKQPSAAVSIHFKSGRSLNKISVEGIQNLVASSVEGLKPSNVNVLDEKGKILNEAPKDEKTLAGLTSTQYELQMKLEQYLTSKVQSLLDGVLGAGNSEIRVNTELDFSQLDSTKTVFDPESVVPLNEQKSSDINSVGDSSYSIGKRFASRSDSSFLDGKRAVTRELINTNTNYEISRTVGRFIKEIGGIRRLTVGAIINSNKIMNVPGKEIPVTIQRTPGEIDTLERIVKNAVGYDPNRNDQVNLLMVPFNNNQVEELPKEETVWDFFRDKKLIFLISAILITIFLMYRLLHSKQITDKLRMALALPEHIENEPEREEEIEEIEFSDDDLMLLPAEFPDQLLLEGDRRSRELPSYDDDKLEIFDVETLAERAKARLEKGEIPDMNEDTIMRLEIKGKVQDYVNDRTNEAVKLVRILLSQDAERKF